MKKNFKILILFAVLMTAFTLTSCSSSAGGGDGSSSTDVSRFFGKFAGTLTYESETLGVEIEIGTTEGYLGAIIKRETGGGGI